MDSRAKHAVRRAFEQAAARYDQAAFLQREIARRLDDHLVGIKLDPRRILDAGCGTGLAIPLLKARYPKATIAGLDIAYAMVKHAQMRHRRPSWWRRRLAGLRTLEPGSCNLICADLEQLPLANAGVDLVWSNLALQWVDLELAFREVRRVLRPGGLFMFSTFGPDTLMELRGASRDLDEHAHVNRFIDMHDIGDALVHAGFADPVMEMERLTLTYAQLKDLLLDLRAIGAHTVLDNGRRGLMGKTVWKRLQQNYEGFRREGRLPATYEVVYGHAWGAERKQLDDGRQVIRWNGR